MFRINDSMEYDDIPHKKKCDEEHYNENQDKREHNDDPHKRKQDKKHHKKHRNSELHKRKHHKKHHGEVHHKREHDDNLLEIKQDKNYFIERDLFNLFKNYSAENNNYGALENNIEDKNLDLSKEDLENKSYTCFENLYNEDGLEENHNTIEAEEISKDTLNNQVDEIETVNCKTTVTSEILPLCDNITHTSEVTVEPVTVKIPVVLTECTVTITIESSLKLEDVVLEIKHIRENVYLNQCELIPSSEDSKPNTGILFVDGFIRKNIEYTTKDHNANGASCGKIKHATVKVPFKCTTRVRFKTYPKFKPNNYQDEVKILQNSIKVFKPCEEEIIGGDIQEQSFKIIEYFNEKVFCELISAEIIESDILENPINKECKTPLVVGSNNITEKVVLLLTIKLLQNQHVDISKGG